MTVKEIIDFARYRLGDTDKSGWADKRLLQLVDAGYKDFCRRTGILRTKVFIGLANDVGIYPLPRDSFDILRVEYRGNELPLVSREDLDNLKTKPSEAYIKSGINMESIELSTIPKGLDYKVQFTVANDAHLAMSASLGVVTGSGIMVGPMGTLLSAQVSGNPAISKPDAYGEISTATHGPGLYITIAKSVGNGVVTQVKVDNSGPFGFNTSVNNIGILGYGVTTDALIDDEYITVYYRSVPETVKSVVATLKIDETWRMALIHYVTGMARQDDNDEGNYKIGSIELAAYEELVSEASKASAKNFSSQVSKDNLTIYRRF